MAHPVAAISRVRRLLHLLFGLGVVAALSGAAAWFAQGEPASALAGVLVVTLAGVAWWFRMSDRYPRAASLVLALCGVGALAFVDTLGLPLLFTALIVLVVDWGMWLGVAVAATMVAILVALLHADTGGNLEAVIGQTLMNSALFVVILIFAAVLRAFDHQHAELLLVNERLTEAMDASRDLVLAQERARAAAELHDGLGQQLTLVSMSLDYADRTRARDPEPAWAEVANASVVVKQALADMRLWVRALHPARLDQLTEPSAFESVAEVFRGTGLDVQVEIAPDERLERPHALFAYRLIQEGLTNALRHARATRVVFRIERDADGLRLTVGDNGAGDGEIQPGFGLRGLTERAEELGGTLRLNRPGGLGGLDVIAELPAVTA